ncbi:MAG: S-layer homology domain-containing protein [Cyanobacteria bacterium P01_C01_bin.120]
MPFAPRPKHPRQFQSLRHRDDWVIVLAALMTLVGSLGWFVANRLFTLESSADLLPSDQEGLLSESGSTREGTSGHADGANIVSPNVVVPEPQVPNSAEPNRWTLERSPISFTDVPETYGAKPYIDALTARNILNGLPNGTFAPEQPLSRAELATQVARAFAVPERTRDKNFTDLAPDYWATESINQAVAKGFMTGYPAGDFRPEQTVSRLQVLVALSTGLGMPAATANSPQIQSYTDWQAIPPWARRQVAAAIQAGIVEAGSDDERRLRPNDSATRGEVAVMVYQALVYLGDAEALP